MPDSTEMPAGITSARATNRLETAVTAENRAIELGSLRNRVRANASREVAVGIPPADVQGAMLAIAAELDEAGRLAVMATRGEPALKPIFSRVTVALDGVKVEPLGSALADLDAIAKALAPFPDGRPLPTVVSDLKQECVRRGMLLDEAWKALGGPGPGGLQGLVGAIADHVKQALALAQRADTLEKARERLLEKLEAVREALGITDPLTDPAQAARSMRAELRDANERVANQAKTIDAQVARIKELEQRISTPVSSLPPRPAQYAIRVRRQKKAWEWLRQDGLVVRFDDVHRASDVIGARLERVFGLEHQVAGYEASARDAHAAGPVRVRFAKAKKGAKRAAT